VVYGLRIQLDRLSEWLFYKSTRFNNKKFRLGRDMFTNMPEYDFRELLYNALIFRDGLPHWAHHGLRL
jgi:predicted HTH transcriptional regulator